MPSRIEDYAIIGDLQTAARQHATGVEPPGSGELRTPNVQQAPSGRALALSVHFSSEEQSSFARLLEGPLVAVG
jgi:hypothetical protein